jgi:hypothetical protein
VSDLVIEVEALARGKKQPTCKVEEFVAHHAPVSGGEPVSPAWKEAFLAAVQEAWERGRLARVDR